MNKRTPPTPKPETPTSEASTKTKDALVGISGDLEDLLDALHGCAELSNAQQITRSTGREVRVETQDSTSALLWLIVDRFDAITRRLAHVIEDLSIGGGAE
jgi:hypothetical protein